MPEKYKKFLEKHKTKLIVLMLAFFVLDAALWRGVFAGSGASDLHLYFLDVGQGDSELIELPAPIGGQAGSVQVLVDGGPANSKALAALGDILAPTDRYIDLVILSHAESDHFGGLIDILKRYQVGAFIWNGRPGSAGAYGDLMRSVEASGARVLVLGAGDAIRYGSSKFNVLSPTPAFLAGTEMNNTSFVLQLAAQDITALFMGDIGEKVEAALASRVGRVEILKVAHHGSKFSSTAPFLAAVRPLLAGIEVGENNYGHPAPETLARLAAVGAKIFRTDKNGTVEVIADEEGIKVFAR